MNTNRNHTAQFTRPLINLHSKAMRAADVLDSLRRAFVAAFRLYTSAERKLVALARMSMLAIRKNASQFFGSPEIADSFLMGGY